MTSLAQVQQLAVLGADYAGFIFYEKSPRYVADKILSSDLKSFKAMQKVGVFVNESAEKILQTVDTYGLNLVQLHGDESPEYCNSLRSYIPIIKAFRVKGDESLTALTKPYENLVDYFLFDNKAKEYGGTGKKFDWSALGNTTFNTPYFLSGGIGMDDTDAVQTFLKKQSVFALDVNSRFETAPGIKDLNLVELFIQAIK